jgi:Domain of unknown function (DUF4389)
VAGHPIRVVVTDDLHRSRVTVFFRLLLAIPHFFWFGLWTIGALVLAIPNWVATLIAGRPPAGLHDFLARYVRYSVQLNAYVTLAADPFPPFSGRPGRYPIDVEIDGPGLQSRWKTGFRLVLAIPALLVAVNFIGVGGSYGGRGAAGVIGAVAPRAEYATAPGGIFVVVSLLAWFACLARGRITQGFRDVLVYGLRYVAQVDGYLFMLTDRYPDADPGEPLTRQTPANPIDLRLEDDGRQSRLTVLFRLLLALPHLVWLVLWSIAVLAAAIVGWFVTLFAGRLPNRLHRFLAAYVRYTTHLAAFIYLVGNPFPGFVGSAGSYPVDLELPERARQNRWITGFRLFLSFPALLVSGALDGLLAVVAVLGWFASLVTGRMPAGLQRMGAFVLRYHAQVNGYLLLLTDRYPYSGPWINVAKPEARPELLVWS